MSRALIENLRAQCGGPRDGAWLRYALGHALLHAGDDLAAIDELRQAVAFDPHYSAAWKLLGKAYLAAHDKAGAAKAWRQGMAVAKQQGDKQAEKEMAVFLRRIEGAT